MALEIGVLNCTTGAKGTGTAGCMVNPNNINNLILVEKGWSLDETTDTLAQADIDELIQSGVMIPLPGHFAREDASEEYVYETSEIGVKIKVRPGNMEMVVTYAKGVCFSKALESLSSKKLDVLLVDYEDGVARLWGAYNNGKFKGFDLSLNNAETFQLPTGTTGAKKPLRIQFSPKGTVEFNSMMNFLTSDVDFGAIDGINDVVLEAENSTAADFQVSVKSACDKTTSFEGFDNANAWRVIDTSDQSTVVPSGVTYADGVYTIAGVPAGSYTVQLYDVTNGSSVATLDAMYFKSNVLAVTLS